MKPVSGIESAILEELVEAANERGAILTYLAEIVAGMRGRPIEEVQQEMAGRIGNGDSWSRTRIATNLKLQDQVADGWNNEVGALQIPVSASGEGGDNASDSGGFEQSEWLR